MCRISEVLNEMASSKLLCLRMCVCVCVPVHGWRWNLCLQRAPTRPQPLCLLRLDPPHCLTVSDQELDPEGLAEMLRRSESEQNSDSWESSGDVNSCPVACKWKCVCLFLKIEASCVSQRVKPKSTEGWALNKLGCREMFMSPVQWRIKLHLWTETRLKRIWWTWFCLPFMVRTVASQREGCGFESFLVWSLHVHLRFFSCWFSLRASVGVFSFQKHERISKKVDKVHIQIGQKVFPLIDVMRIRQHGAAFHH